MDRYFYSVEMDGDHNVVHMSGNVFFNDADETETCYRVAEWTGMFIDVEELRNEMLDEQKFFDSIIQRVGYLTDVTEQQAVNICITYWNGEPGEQLHIREVNENTPCGTYWFEH